MAAIFLGRIGAAHLLDCGTNGLFTHIVLTYTFHLADLCAASMLGTAIDRIALLEGRPVETEFDLATAGLVDLGHLLAEVLLGALDETLFFEC